MTSLEQFGIIEPVTSSPALHAETCEMGHDEYIERTSKLLEELGEVVTGTVVPQLENFSGVWHPSGFVVFQLGVHPDFGQLRLHVWPESLRKLGDIGDTIHDHSWHVSSLVLKGVYSDDITDLESVTVDSEEKRRQEGLLHVFEARYSEKDQSIVLATDGDCVRITSRQERHVPEGDTHAIEPRIFHQPTIPSTIGTATLVLNSFRAVEHGPYVLMDVPNEQQPPRGRQPATSEDINSIKQLFK